MHSRINLPWTESPYFEEELNARDHLSQTEKEQAEFYNKNGYLILSSLVDSKLIEDVRNDLENNYNTKFSYEDPRSMNLWKQSDPVKSLAIEKSIMDKLQMLYGRKPIPFQTLNFKYGSRQNPHSDSIHFHSFPALYMCGAWVVLEDVDESNGTIIYYPGSHKLSVYDYSSLSKDFNIPKDLSETFYQDQYEPFIKQLMKVNGMEPKTLTIKKGDILIWSANLVHGGLPIQDKRTRWSQVTHYYFENCLYYTPQFSNPISGEWSLREIQNIENGQYTWGDYNGYVPIRKKAPLTRFLLSSYSDLSFLMTRVYYKIFK